MHILSTTISLGLLFACLLMSGNDDDDSIAAVAGDIVVHSAHFTGATKVPQTNQRSETSNQSLRVCSAAIMSFFPLVCCAQRRAIIHLQACTCCLSCRLCAQTLRKGQTVPNAQRSFPASLSWRFELADCQRLLGSPRSITSTQGRRHRHAPRSDSAC